jgi:transcriptional regulator with GAF, ATPase, and Fis domain
MSKAKNRGAKGPSSPAGALASVLLREAVIDSRLDALREVALTLLNEVESLRSSQPPRADHSLKLHDEVRKFEIDLIHTALVKTGGNQTRAARLLGVKLTTLNTKIKRYRISFVDHQAEHDKNVQGRWNAA